jgi:hypothetical protein
MSEDATSESAAIPTDPSRLAITVDVWKYIVSVQMHFNDMEMKVRNLYFTILAASMGLIGVVQGKKIAFQYIDVTISLSIVVVFAMIPISMLFYFMDRHWYHRLLQGAVAQCIAIEERYKDQLPEIQLGTAISKASPVKFGGIWRYVLFFIRDERFRQDSRLHSDQKIEVLYKSVIFGAILIILVYGGMNGLRIHKCPVVPLLFNISCGGH